MSTTLNLGVGLHENISEADYHADRLCEAPTLSRSTGELFLTASPMHVYYNHPRLGGAPEIQDGEASEEPNAAMDFGSLAHKILLGKGAEIAVGEWKTWQSNDSKAFRKEARAAGKIPTLQKAYDRANKLSAVALSRFQGFGVYQAFMEAKSEVVALFDEGEGVRCRIMYDKLLLSPGNITIFDVKITGSAKPKACERQIQNMGYDYQEGCYRSGMQRLFPDMAGRERFIFLFIEDTFPFAVTPMELNGEWKTIGISKWNYVAQCWKQCMEKNQWPAYTTDILRAAPKEWALGETMGLEMPKFKETA